MKHVLHILLWPFALLYGVVTALRNLAYERGWLKSVSFDDVVVVCVGNITVGGTGKTPHVEYIIRKLAADHRLAVLSRGYRRKTKGFVLADASSTARDIGDEPCQLKRKFPDLPVAVDADRVNGVRRLKTLNPAPEIILLDDAFQHRRIKPKFSILLADFNRPLYRDCMLPAGRLREWTCFARRADLLIVTKTPDSTTDDELCKVRKRYSRFFDKDIRFSSFDYGSPKPVFAETSELHDVNIAQASILLITGIASPAPLLDYLRRYCKSIEHISYPDHHAFTAADIQHIATKWRTNTSENPKLIITTEKDAVRLRLLPIDADLKQAMFYIPIEVRILEK